MLSEPINNLAVIVDILFQPQVWGVNDPYMKLDASRHHCSANILPMECESQFFPEQKTIKVSGRLKLILSWGFPGTVKFENLPTGELCDAIALLTHVCSTQTGIIQLPKEIISLVPMWSYTKTSYDYIDWKRNDKPVRLISNKVKTYFDNRQNPDGHWVMSAILLFDMVWSVTLEELEKRANLNPFVVKNKRYGFYTAELVDVNKIQVNLRDYDNAVIEDIIINEDNR
jgi:hypothetical protein